MGAPTSASTRVVPRHRWPSLGVVPRVRDDSKERRSVTEGYEASAAARRPAGDGPRGHRHVARRTGVRAQPGADRRRAELDLLRGPADRERHARHPPRRGAGVQGRLPPLQDDEGLPRPRGWPAGTATACRSSWRWRRSSASPASPTSRRTASPSSTRAAARTCSATSTRSRQMSERMGYWADYENAYWTMTPDYVESVWWALKTDLRQGPAGRGLPGRAVLHPMRHRAVRPRAGAGLRDGRRPVGLRPAAADLRPVGRAGRDAGLDDHAVDAAQQRRWSR